MLLVFQLFLAMGIAWSISGIVQLALREKNRQPDTGWAIAVILVFLLTILDNLLRPENIPMSVLNYIYPVTRVSYFLIGPILWFYMESLIKGKVDFKLRHLLHALPFLFWFIYICLEPAALHPEVVFAAEAPQLRPPRQPHPAFAFLKDLSLNLSRFGYCAAILFRQYRHARRLPDLVSYMDNRNTLSWLRTLLSFYAGLYLLGLFIHFIFPDESGVNQIYEALVRHLPPVLFVFFFSLYSGKQPLLENTRIESERAENVPIQDEGEQKNRKYLKSGLSDSESKELFSSLMDYLSKSKSHLDPDLALNTLAGQMGETRHRLSEVINRESGEKFYTFINRLRLAEFKNAVKTNRFPDYNILTVSLECGFKSSSAFYSLFKKEFGTTPKKWSTSLKNKDLLSV